MRTQIGTPCFQAPEILDIVETGGEYTNAVDIWSLGCVLYKVLTGTVPFANFRSIDAFCSAKTAFPSDALIKRNCSDLCITFIQQMLVPDPFARPTAQSTKDKFWLESARDKATPMVAFRARPDGAAYAVLKEPTPEELCDAAFWGRTSVIFSAIRCDCDLNARLFNGHFPLMEATKTNQWDVVNLLLVNGASVDQRNEYSQTCLHQASQFGKLEIVRLLLRYGAGVGVVDRTGKTPLDLALHHGQKEVFLLLFEEYPNMEPSQWLLAKQKGWTEYNSATSYIQLKF